MDNEVLNNKQQNMFDRDTKIFQSLNGNRYYCKCGHSVIITPRQERAFCDWCRHWVYKDAVEQQKHDEITKAREDLLRFKKEMRKHL